MKEDLDLSYPGPVKHGGNLISLARRAVRSRVVYGLFAMVAFFTAGVLQAVEVASLDIDGNQYFDARLRLEGEVMVRIIHRDGVLRTSLDKLPEDLRVKLAPKEFSNEEKEEMEGDSGAVEEASAVRETRFDRLKSLYQVSLEDRYKIEKEHVIRNAGKHYKVVVSPELVNTLELRKVIEEFMKKTASERMTIVTIFDDSRAVSMMMRFSELSDEEGYFYDKSFKAMYTKNRATGFHQSVIHPEGLNGERVIIEH